MGVLDRFERGIEKAVNGAFARAFKSEVQPVEIASALRRAMDDRAAVVGRGRTLVPNAFVVELGPSDYARLTEYADVLAEELDRQRQRARRGPALRLPRPGQRRLRGARGHWTPASSRSAPAPSAGRAGQSPRRQPPAPAPPPRARRGAGAARRAAGRDPPPADPRRVPVPPLGPAPGPRRRCRVPSPAAEPSRQPARRPLAPRRPAGPVRRSRPPAGPGSTSTATPTRCSARSPWSAAGTTPTSSWTTRASPAGTPRSGSPPTGRTWSRTSATSARPTAPSSTATGSPARELADGNSITLGRTRLTFRSGER